MSNLFVYGSLMAPDIIELVLGRSLVGSAGVLYGFRRAKIRGVSYPGIMRNLQSSVHGIVYTNLKSSDFVRLDYFEGNMYERTEVAITLSVVGQAHVYILKDEFSHLLSNEPWNFEEFEERHKDDFIRSYKGWS